MNFIVGRKHIWIGQRVALSRRGFLKPAGPSEYIIGSAISKLPRGKKVELKGSQFAYPSYDRAIMTYISCSYVPQEYISEKVFPKI